MKIRSLISVASLIFASLIIVIPQSQASLTCAQGGECVVGDTGPGGGKVFFVKSIGSFTKSRTVSGFMYSQTYTLSLTADQQAALPFDYLEVAPTQSATMRWGSNGLIPGGTSTLIGTGASNTASIISNFPSDNASNNAAYWAESYTNNSLSDWFLPSYDELLLFNILSLEADSGGPDVGSITDGHWTSTTNDNFNARYSARTQLSGDVTKASSAKAIAIRSFSKAPVVNSSKNNVDTEALRREYERKRQEEILNAQREIIRKVRAHIDLLKSDLSAAEALLIGEELLSKANKDLAALDTATTLDFPQINFVINKYGVYDQIAGNISGKVYARNLVAYGVLQPNTPMKSLITRDLIALPAEARDTYEEINAYLAKAIEVQRARKERLAAIIAKIHSR